MSGHRRLGGGSDGPVSVVGDPFWRADARVQKNVRMRWAGGVGVALTQGGVTTERRAAKAREMHGGGR